MNVSFKINKQIEELFTKNEILWASEISNILWISRTITHKALKDLLTEKKVKKVGKWAHTRYASLIFTWKSDENIVDFIVDFKSKKLFDEIFYKLECLIQTQEIDSIAIIPWSIERKNQLLWILKFRLKSLNIPFINLIKYFENDISIPQKSIKSKEWRIQNAKNTIFINDKDIKKYQRVLLIDDFVGSWSTLNISAWKLKKTWIKEIIWFSFVGSLDLTYEVINEI